tara:strand:+ start:84 stop:398 length:315 start_codon:yes stop_codon:yes gene_type:complete
MPYKHTEKKIPKPLDRRVKLTDEDRVHIFELKGYLSQRAIAKQYGVSRRLVQFIHDPEKHKKNLEARIARGGSKQYYDKDKWRELMKDHRRYKQQLYKNGELTK